MLGIIESDIAKTGPERVNGAIEDISFGAGENVDIMWLERYYHEDEVSRRCA